MSAITTSGHHWVWARAVRQENEIKGMHIGKEVKLSLLTSNIILFELFSLFVKNSLTH